MTEHTRVAVIGGGIVGCSILYHLAELGWTDIVLLERTELTAGSTWHAAANGNTFMTNPAHLRLVMHSMDHWENLEKMTGQPTSFHHVGGLLMAESQDRYDELHRIQGIGEKNGVHYDFLDADQIVEMAPIVAPEGVLGALFDPYGGHIDPYGLTHAYAKGARNMGAKVMRNSPVTELHPQADGTWHVVTPDQTIHAEIIVNAAGFRANEIAALTKARLPMMAMQHHYIITEPVDEVMVLDKEFPVLRNSDRSFYMRREGQGLLLGTYEAESHTFGENGIPLDFGQELLPGDLDRIAPFLEGAMTRVPCMQRAGIKRVVNGPFCFTPDVSPLLGWMPSQRNHFVAAGFLAGINMGGGFGKMCAQWMVEGAPEEDMTFADVARYGKWAEGEFELARAHEMYSERYKVHYPSEELESGRPIYKTAAYDKQKARGAVFGMVYGWERPLWFAPKGTEPKDIYSFRRANWFAATGDECRALRDKLGIIDIQPFAVHEVSGPGAEAFLNHLLTNRVPSREGRLVLSPMVDESGRLIGDFTLNKVGDENYQLTGSGALRGLHGRWFERHLPAEGVTVTDRSDETGGFAIAGPGARDLLSRLISEDLSAEAFPFLASREVSVAGIAARVHRVSFTGDLGYEVHISIADHGRLYDALLEAGEDLGAVDVGARAMDSLRLEKGWGRMGAEFTRDTMPFEVGLGRFVKMDKADFIGRDALLQAQEAGIRYQLVLLDIDADDADAWANEPVYQADTIVGSVTSGGFGHTVGKSIALALIEPGLAQTGTMLQVDILGQRRPATVSMEALFDPTGARLRS
jgi:dimethylglycine dehydrogenase